MKVCSFNIWSNAPVKARWVVRRDAVARALQQIAPDIAGLQEATLAMIRDLLPQLPGYQWVGAGRDDGREAGEFTPILFRSGRLRVIEHASFWLSAASELPGRGWDAAHPRIVTWALFEEAESGRRFLHLNTHLDHLGRRARVESARLLCRKAAEIGRGEPGVLTGDFNCRDTSAPYRILTGRLPFAVTSDSAASWRDTRHDAEQMPAGPRRTFLGVMSLFGLGRIDYVFVNGGFRTLRHAVVDVAGASDHRPVLAELAFTNRTP